MDCHPTLFHSDPLSSVPGGPGGKDVENCVSSILRFRNLAVGGLAGCGLGGRAHGPASPNASAVVDMGFSSFQPESVHIRAGQMVEWRNSSVITHSVTD